MNVRFPTEMTFRTAVFGPVFNTTINEGDSGYEDRERNWAQMRSKFTASLTTPASFGSNRQAWIDALMGFFLANAGKWQTFRVRDPLDYKATQQTMIHVSGNIYQLQKTYAMGDRAYVRVITRPVTNNVIDWLGNSLLDTVSIYVGGVLQISGYTVDASTGLVTCTGFSGAAALVDFEFDVPARFDTDELPLQIEESFVSGGNPLAAWDSIPLIEVLPETTVDLGAPSPPPPPLTLPPGGTFDPQWTGYLEGYNEGILLESGTTSGNTRVGIYIGLSAAVGDTFFIAVSQYLYPSLPTIVSIVDHGPGVTWAALTPMIPYTSPLANGNFGFQIWYGKATTACSIPFTVDITFSGSAATQDSDHCYLTYLRIRNTVGGSFLGNLGQLAYGTVPAGVTQIAPPITTSPADSLVLSMIAASGNHFTIPAPYYLLIGSVSIFIAAWWNGARLDAPAGTYAAPWNNLQGPGSGTGGSGSFGNVASMAAAVSVSFT